ncbi:MAG TPA: 4Fe-4S dicluster domain-containing protein [Anaeromyxobacter sp.]|nr:4Fe-4S dicluster domain-containing protein [Anaeromyxobacter sp.]
MTIGRRFLRWRRIAGGAQALVALGLPFVTVGGESALRLDVPAGRLHAFGASFAVDEAFVVLAATLLVTAAFLLVTVLLGRAWCGWACPQTVLGDLVDLAAGRGAAARLIVSAVVSAVVAADLVWYFVPPGEFLRGLAAGTLGPWASGSWAALSVVLFLDLALLGARFCATVCPYAKLQGVLFDRSTLVIAYDARRDGDCVDCDACVRVCPTGIDIRDGLQAECIACAACIDACTPIMARLRRPPHLVGYAWGAPGGRARPLRPGVLALAGATAACVALLVAVVAGRPAFDLVVVADDAFATRRAPDGKVLAAWGVALENRARAPVEVALALSVPGAEVSVRPERIALGAGERRQVRVLATARGLPPGRAEGTLAAEARAAGGDAERRTERIVIAAPEGP